MGGTKLAVALAILGLLGPALAGCVGPGDDATDPGASADPGGHPYLQMDGTAARTGMLLDRGPATSDVAFEVQLAGARSDAAVPLIINRAAFVLTTDYGIPDLDEVALWRIDLDTAQVTRHIPLDQHASGLASDGERFFITRDLGVDAYHVEGGEKSWSWNHEHFVTTEHNVTRCADPAARDHLLVVACTERGVGFAVNERQEERAHEAVVFTAALDASTGEQRWINEMDVEEYFVRPESVTSANVGFGSVDPALQVTNPWGYGVSVVGDRVLVVTTRGEFGGDDETLIHAYDVETGTYQWTRSLIEQNAAPTEDEFVRSPTVEAFDFTLCPALATGEPGRIFWKATDILAEYAETGARAWSKVYPSTSTGNIIYACHSMAYSPNAAYVSTGNAIYRIDPTTRETVWAHSLPQLELLRPPGLLVANGTVYARSIEAGQSGSLPLVSERQKYANRINAIDAETGALKWRWTITSVDHEPHTWVKHGIGEGVLVAATIDGVVTVIGRTAASVAPQAAASDSYPGVGETIVLDMAESAPGVMGPPTEYAVDWGDGTKDPWQTDPVFRHQYDFAGQQTATLRARNDAGQTGSKSVTFDVGGSPPSQPNAIETAFDRENQDLTFGVLGILVAVGGGMFAVARARTRRGRLQRELAAIEQAYEANRERLMDCEAALAERRAHVQGLALDGALDEGHVALLERRIEELRRQLRLGALDERLQFLPHGMVVRLRDMLDDGHISAWEREHVLRALDEDGVLTKHQKGKVRDLVDSWFQRDAETA